MSLPRVLFRVGHKGRPSKPFDVGAARAGNLNEVNCNEIVVRSAMTQARQHQQYAPFDSHHGEYGDCHNWAVRNGIRVYLNCHLNAHADTSISAGKFFYHDETSPGNGDRLAEILAQRTAAWGQKWLGRPYKTHAIRSSPGDWTRNAHYTIKKFGRGVRGVGICAEPLMISNPEDRAVLCRPQPLAELGLVYDASVLQWLQERGLIA